MWARRTSATTDARCDGTIAAVRGLSSCLSSRRHGRRWDDRTGPPGMRPTCNLTSQPVPALGRANVGRKAESNGRSFPYLNAPCSASVPAAISGISVVISSWRSGRRRCASAESISPLRAPDGIHLAVGKLRSKRLLVDGLFLIDTSAHQAAQAAACS
jgi:hypothetical protein